MILLFSILIASQIVFAQSKNIEQGDYFYSKRAEGAEGILVDGKNIDEAIKHYKLAMQNSSTREIAAGKLLQSYYFKGSFTSVRNTNRKKYFETVKEEGKKLRKEFPNNTEIAYWYSVDLAIWATLVNPLVALGAGAVSESRSIASFLISKEKTNKIAAARGYQILGQAHHRIPKIAFVLNWVNRDSAVVYLKKSRNLNPNDLPTNLFLAQYLKEHNDEQGARKILEPILNSKPRPNYYLEDMSDMRKMRRVLEKK